MTQRLRYTAHDGRIYVMCDPRCWGPVLTTLGTTERAIAHITLRADPADHQAVWFCVACAGCGKTLLRPPEYCHWHGDRCPDRDPRFTARTVLAARDLLRRAQVVRLPTLATAMLLEAANHQPDDGPRELADPVWRMAHMWLRQQT